MKKIKNINDWEVLTPSGWQNFSGIQQISDDKYISIKTLGCKKLSGSVGHKIKMSDNTLKKLNDIEINDILIGNDIIIEKIFVDDNIYLYDLLNVDNGHVYYQNDIVGSNCAFIQPIETIWTAAAPAVTSHGSACTLISTPNGAGNFFHKTWVAAEDGMAVDGTVLKFNPIKLPWYIHPERTQKWRDAQVVILGSERRAAQECDASFITSGHTVIPAEIIEYYSNNFVTMPIEKRYNELLWIWEYPESNKDYIVSADVGRGDGGDFSAFHVIDVLEQRQICEYKSQIGTIEFAKLLVNIAREYNNALLVIENANVGWSTVLHAIEILKYDNIYFSLRTNKQLDAESQILKHYDLKLKEDMVPGFTTSNLLRPLIISKFETYLQNKEFIIQSKRTIDEIRTFIWYNNKPQAMNNYNDDLIMALCIGMWVRDTALMLRQKGIDLTKSSINAMKQSSKAYQIGYNSAKQMAGNPYEVQTGYGAEDISWILNSSEQQVIKTETDATKAKYDMWRQAYRK